MIGLLGKQKRHTVRVSLAARIYIRMHYVFISVMTKEQVVDLILKRNSKTFKETLTPGKEGN